MGWYSLSNSEHTVMEFFWGEGETASTKTLNEVIEYMETRGFIWKQQTAHTVLSKLAAKGLIGSRKDGFRRHYQALLTEQEYISKWTSDLVDEKFGGSLKNFLIAFSGGGNDLSHQQAKELADLLED